MYFDLETRKFDVFNIGGSMEEIGHANILARSCILFDNENNKWFSWGHEWGYASLTWSNRRATLWQFEHWKYVVYPASGNTEIGILQCFIVDVHDVQRWWRRKWFFRGISKDHVLHRFDGAGWKGSFAFICVKFEDTGVRRQRRIISTADRRAGQTDFWPALSTLAGWDTVHYILNREARSTKSHSLQITSSYQQTKSLGG